MKSYPFLQFEGRPQGHVNVVTETRDVIKLYHLTDVRTGRQELR